MRSYRGYRGYNSRVITPGITGDAEMLQCTQSGNTGGGVTGVMDVGIQVLQGMCTEAFTPKLHV